MCCSQHGSVRVDSVDDFAYGSPILVNTMDKVKKIEHPLSVTVQWLQKPHLSSLLLSRCVAARPCRGKR